MSLQLKAARGLGEVHPEVLLSAAAPVLEALAAECGYERSAVFGSVARRKARGRTPTSTSTSTAGR